MIPFAEINTAANKYQVAAETIEKDYVISWILHCLSKSDFKNTFIFYGGTAIKRVYFEDHRFSEDIDLISDKRFNLDYILHELNILHYAKEAINLSLEINPARILSANGRIQLFIEYIGYDEIQNFPKEIRLDFSMGMDLFGEIENKKLIASYSDLKNQNKLRVMTLNTIFANKLGLLGDSTRNEPRDLFDIWFLLNRIGHFNFDIKKVCKAYRDKYGFVPNANIIISQLRNNALKLNWEMRLKKQVNRLPEFTEVTKSIKNSVENLF